MPGKQIGFSNVVKSVHQLLYGYNLQKVFQISIALGRDLSSSCWLDGNPEMTIPSSTFPAQWGKTSHNPGFDFIFLC